MNELNYLASLRCLQQLALTDCPLAAREGSSVFYRARVLRRLPQLAHLDDDAVSAREKVKARVMHGSDVVSRQHVFAKHLPGHEFTNFLYVRACVWVCARVSVWVNAKPLTIVSASHSRTPCRPRICCCDWMHAVHRSSLTVTTSSRN